MPPRDLDKVQVWKDEQTGLDAPWWVWIPPRGPEDYEGGNAREGAMIAPYGETSWPTIEAACSFVSDVLNRPPRSWELSIHYDCEAVTLEDAVADFREWLCGTEAAENSTVRVWHGDGTCTYVDGNGESWTG